MLSDEELGTSVDISEDELRGRGALERAHLPSLNKLSNLISLMEANAQRKKMKVRDERMNRFPSDGFDEGFIL